MKRIVVTVVAVALTMAALWFVLAKSDMESLRSALRAAHWPGMLLAFAITAAVQWLRAWRFSLLTFGAPALPGWRLIGISFQLNLLNYLLPFRLGEFGYPAMMHKAFRQNPLEALGVLLLARVLDLACVGAILLFTGAWLGLAGQGWAMPVMIATICAVAFVAGLYLLSARHGARALSAGTRHLRSVNAWLLAAGLSFAIWLVFGVAAAVASQSVTTGVSVAAAFLGAAAGNLAFALPVNGIAGLGPSQAAWVAAVIQTGASLEDAVAGALAVYIVTLAGALIFGAVAFAVSWRAGQTPAP